MTAQRQREIVIEFEKVQLIRKRAKTELQHCDGCGAVSDAVSQAEAAELFEITPENLFEFIKQSDCHYHVSYNGITYLCVVSLLERMNQQNNIRRLAEKGEIKMKNTIKNVLLSIFAMLLAVTSISTIWAAPVTRFATGANPAAIQATVDQFRADLGGANNGVGGSFKTGRREINWDGVPDSFSAPNFLPVNFFNSNSPRGVVFNTNRSFGDTNAFIVSADSSNSTATPVRFADIDPSYSAIFQTFSAERLFIARSHNVTTVEFFIPGTNIPATVKGFGAVFADVDQSGPTYIKYYGENGNSLGIRVSFTANNGLSFVGLSFNAGERITRVDIISGNQLLAAGNIDGAGNNDSNDLVAMDDFIYGEPRAAQFHEGDFDGDGFKDPAVFRPSAGVFFVLNTGSSTVDSVPFGIVGDVPVEGDFDGDKQADVAIFRPSVGEWWIQKSSNGSISASQFGQTGDKPQPGDFDKDGKTDIAFWRPADGSYFVLRSSNNSFFSFPWGANGDIPIGSPDVP